MSPNLICPVTRAATRKQSSNLAEVRARLQRIPFAHRANKAWVLPNDEPPRPTVDLNFYQSFERYSGDGAESGRVKWPEPTPRLRLFGRVLDTCLAIKKVG